MNKPGSLLQDAIMELEQYALEHYEQGGHWVCEGFDLIDYMDVLEHCRGNVPEAKAQVKKYWETIRERERESAWGGEW